MSEGSRHDGGGRTTVFSPRGAAMGFVVTSFAGWALALALVLSSCSGSPAPVTRGSAAAASPGPAAAASPAAAGTAQSTPHSSEAEIKSAPVAPPLVSASPATSPAAPAAAPIGAAAAPGSPAGPSAQATGIPDPSTTADSLPPVPVHAAPTAAPNLVTPIDAPAGRKSDPSVVVVEPADPDPDSTLSLVDAAKAERERKAEATPPRIVINNKNIHAYAKGGQLTIAEPKTGTAAAPASTAAAAAATTTPAGDVAPIVRDEKYWRGRALEIRQRWRKAADRIKQLEGDVNLWRRRFYAEDDPYVRDGQIKPAWDRALDELREDHEAVAAAKKELDDFLEEGRRAGALPGWLREGNELEPVEEKPVDPLQPTETPIYKENG